MTASNLNLSLLAGKKVLITGANGLIGKAIVAALLNYDGEEPINVVALVRNAERAKKVLGGLPQDNLEYLVSDVCGLKPVDLNVDYIIHGASFTASKAFVLQPVDVIDVAVTGTKRLLEFARANRVKSFVYLSSMEVYGTHNTDDKVFEDSPVYVDTSLVRSCYPESKRLCESLCTSYCAQYGVPAKIVRLTQTFGEGVSYNDTRVFAEFARCVIENKDIVLKTKGETKRNYLFTDDAVSAILTVLLNGGNGEAYNVANEETYCSIYEMALTVSEKFGGGKVKVRFDLCNTEKIGYAPVLKMNLSTEKLQALGWKAETDLVTSFRKTIQSMKESINA